MPSQTAQKMPFSSCTRVLFEADSSTHALSGIHVPCKISKRWNPLRVHSLDILLAVGVFHTRTGLKSWVWILMSLQRRRERYIIIHMWKTWKSLVPNDLEIQFYDHARLETRCKIPSMKKKIHNPRKVHLWCILCCPWTKAIEHHSKRHHFSSIPRVIYVPFHLLSNIPDLPQMPGYTTPNSNSLLEWKTDGLQQVV